MKWLRAGLLLRLCLGSVMLLLAWTWGKALYQSQLHPYEKDLRQGYLLAQALRHGVNPYLPLAELGRRWLPEDTALAVNLPHPTPHPFAVGWLCLPLTTLSYPQAAVAWLVFEVLCLLAALVLWLRLVGWPVRWWTVGALLVGLASWIHLMTDLFLGQLSLCLLLLFLAAWTALRAGCDVWGGVWLGLLLLLKLLGWPLVLWLAYRRRWHAVGATAAVCVGGHLLAIGLHGWGMVRDYYFKVGPLVAALYRGRDSNYSIFSLGQRFFGASGYYLASLPWWDSPVLVKVLTVFLPLVFLAGLLYFTAHIQSFDAAFAILMGAGFFLSPVVWTHYFVLALPALGFLLRCLAARGWPFWETGLAAPLFVLLWVPRGLYVDLAALAAQTTNSAGLPVVPAWAALATLLPAVALGALLILWSRHIAQPK